MHNSKVKNFSEIDRLQQISDAQSFSTLGKKGVHLHSSRKPALVILDDKRRKIL